MSLAALFDPRAVEEWTMFWVALAAVALNGGIMWSLHRDKDRDLNIRASFHAHAGRCHKLDGDRRRRAADLFYRPEYH